MAGIFGSTDSPPRIRAQRQEQVSSPGKQKKKNSFVDTILFP